MAFAESSQVKHWLFSSAEELSSIRAATNSEAIERISKIHTQLGSASEDLVYLTPEEELAICSFYIKKIDEICSVFNPPFPPAVRATSIAYFKRFYLYTSIMDYHPKPIMLTCIYMACKTEEINISLNDFAANVGVSDNDKKMVLQYEVLLLQRLRFELVVYHAYRPLRGFFHHIKLKLGQAATPEFDLVYKKAKETIGASLSSDLFLLVAPSIVALAVLSSASTSFDLSTYINEILQTNKDSETTQYFSSAFQTALNYLTNTSPDADAAVLKKINKKLVKCRNPELDPESKVFSDIAKSANKKEKKAKKSQPSQYPDLGGGFIPPTTTTTTTTM